MRDFTRFNLDILQDGAPQDDIRCHSPHDDTRQTVHDDTANQDTPPGSPTGPRTPRTLGHHSERGFYSCRLTGWDSAPHYDAATTLKALGHVETLWRARTSQRYP